MEVALAPWLLFLPPNALHFEIILNAGDYGFLPLTNRYNRKQRFLTSYPSTSYVSLPCHQAFLEAGSVVVSEPGVVSAVDLAVSEPGVVSAVDLAVSGPEVVSVVGLAVSGPEVVSAVAVSIVHIFERQVFVNIHIVFAVSFPVSFVGKGGDIL
jgi:hypothetical protein